MTEDPPRHPIVSKAGSLSLTASCQILGARVSAAKDSQCIERYPRACRNHSHKICHIHRRKFRALSRYRGHSFRSRAERGAAICENAAWNCALLRKSHPHTHRVTECSSNSTTARPCCIRRLCWLKYSPEIRLDGRVCGRTIYGHSKPLRGPMCHKPSWKT